MLQKLNDIRLGSSEKEEAFYDELDRKTLSRSCCTCQTFLLLFVLFFIAASGFIFYIYWQVTHGGPLNPNLRIAAKGSFEKKLAITQKDNTVKISDDELSSALNLGFGVNNFIFSNLKTNSSEDGLEIYGDLVKPFNSKVLMKAGLSVENGKIKIIVNKVTAGKADIPSYFHPYFSENLTNLINGKLQVLYKKAKIVEASTKDKYIELNLQKKE